MKQESAISKIITAVLGILLVAYVGVQAYKSFYNPVRTVSAVYAEVDDVIEIDGVVVRDEYVFNKNYGSGVLEINMYEGERTGNGNVVAVVYSDEASAEKSRRAAEISEQIDRMTALYSQSAENYDISIANDRISEAATALLTQRQEGAAGNIKAATSELEMRVLEREYIYRDKSELLGVIEELRAEKSKLGSSSSIKKRIYSPGAGYFSQYTDGYESSLTVPLALSGTAEEIREKSESFAQGDSAAVGKLVSTNKWYIVSEIPEKEMKRVSAGSTMKLKFRDKALPSVEAKIVRLDEPKDGKALVVLCCDTHISEFTKVRRLSAEVVVKTYKGLKVPREALRVNEEGVNGVYCLIDSQVKFKPVSIIFEKDSYYISGYDSADKDSLLLYDEIIVSAKNLENKKIVK